jgi:glyoxylase-like metal-dependent hydrolase (beta-lactamase superfamily II)
MTARDPHARPHAGLHDPCGGRRGFVGDTLFMPDGGSARPTFPGGDAGELYDSIQKVLALPDETRLFMCHDYGPNGRDIQWETTVGEEKAHNIHVGGGKTKEEFVKFRTERDASSPCRG